MTEPPGRPPDPLAVRGLTVRYGAVAALRDVSLSVPRGAVYVLLGRSGAGKTSLVRCLLGTRKPSAGAALLFGQGGWWGRRKALARVGVVIADADAPPGRRTDERPAEETVTLRLALALELRPEALVLDDPTAGLDPTAARAFLEKLAAERVRGTTVLLLSSDPEGVERIATHVGILKEGRLAVDEEIEVLKRRFRQIRYRNEVTEARTEYGTELDAFHAVRVKVRGWGVEAVVSNFDDEVFAAFAATAGVVDGRAEALTLEEIFVAVAGEAPPIAAPGP